MIDTQLAGETASKKVAHPEHTTDTTPRPKGLAGAGQAEQDTRRTIGQIPDHTPVQHRRNPLKSRRR